MKAAEIDILVKQCIEWDRNSQSRLYGLYSTKMFAICQRYSQNQEEAEDTLQEGFLKVFDNLKNFKNEGSLEGWIRKIMINTAIEKFRKNSNRLNDISIESSNFDHGCDENATTDIGAKELMVLIQKLPPKCRLIFNLYVIEGYNHRQIAEQLRISEGTSKSNLHDARIMLQRTLSKINEGELIQK